MFQIVLCGACYGSNCCILIMCKSFSAMCRILSLVSAASGIKTTLCKHSTLRRQSYFIKGGILNFHNIHYWCVANSHLYRIHVFSESGVYGDNLFASTVLPPHLKGAVHLVRASNKYSSRLIDNVPLYMRANVVLMYDGTTINFHCEAPIWII